jgi:hypothetical protein
MDPYNTGIEMEDQLRSLRSIYRKVMGGYTDE